MNELGHSPPSTGSQFAGHPGLVFVQYEDTKVWTKKLISWFAGPKLRAAHWAGMKLSICRKFR